jgi:hypothetical protein
MGRGPDLTVVERAIIHAKILANWDSENNRIKHGKIYEIQKLCANCGVRVSKGSVKRLAGEMKAQEGHAEKIFQETGEVTGTIEELITAGTGDGWTPLIITQPPNSPDVNINDLGFFHSLKTDIRKICTHCTSRTEMMANVLQAFEEYPWDKLDNLMVSGPVTSIIFAVSWRAMAEMTTNRLTMVVQSAREIPDLPSTFRST